MQQNNLFSIKFRLVPIKDDDIIIRSCCRLIWIWCKVGYWTLKARYIYHLEPTRTESLYCVKSVLSIVELDIIVNHIRAGYQGGGGVLPYITYTGMCRPTGSWFWSSWFWTGYPFQRRFLERGIKNCGQRLYLLLNCWLWRSIYFLYKSNK